MDDVGLVDVGVHHVIPQVLRAGDAQLGGLVHQAELGIDIGLLLGGRHRSPEISLEKQFEEPETDSTYQDFLWCNEVHSGNSFTAALVALEFDEGSQLATAMAAAQP